MIENIKPENIRNRGTSKAYNTPFCQYILQNIFY